MKSVDANIDFMLFNRLIGLLISVLQSCDGEDEVVGGGVGDDGVAAVGQGAQDAVGVPQVNVHWTEALAATQSFVALLSRLSCWCNTNHYEGLWSDGPKPKEEAQGSFRGSTRGRLSWVLWWSSWPRRSRRSRIRWHWHLSRAPRR